MHREGLFFGCDREADGILSGTVHCFTQRKTTLEGREA